jgi:hypothetical protein
MSLRLNNDSSAIYETYGFAAQATGTTAGYSENYASVGGTQFNLVGKSNSADDLTGWMFFDGCNTTNHKVGQQIMGVTPRASNLAINGGCVYPNSSVISSIEFFSPNGGTNSNGTIKIYGSVN